jgi:hypothetical protein
MKKLFFASLSNCICILLGVGLTCFVAGFVFLGLNKNQEMTTNFHRAAIFGMLSSGLSLIGTNINDNH